MRIVLLPGSQHIFCSSSPSFGLQGLISTADLPSRPDSLTLDRGPLQPHSSSCSSYSSSLADPALLPWGIGGSPSNLTRHPGRQPRSLAVTVRLHRCQVHVQKPIPGLLMSDEPRLTLISLQPHCLMLENALTPAECQVRLCRHWCPQISPWHPAELECNV